jgi:hypothetical protein
LKNADFLENRKYFRKKTMLIEGNLHSHENSGNKKSANDRKKNSSENFYDNITSSCKIDLAKIIFNSSKQIESKR